MRGRFRAGFVALAIGVAGAMSGPAFTAAAATSTTTLHGDVRLGSAALGGYRVGFFDPADGSVIAGTTAADGSFTLQVPMDVAGYAFAGTDPTAQRAISDYRGRKFVRGVVGLHQPSKVAGVIYQSLTPGLPAQLADGGTIHLRLQHSGRVHGTGNLPKGSEVTVERLNGSSVGASGADAHGSFRTPALVPGRYRLVFRGGSVLLARSKVVTVVADEDRLTSVPHLIEGGVLQGRVMSGGKPIAHRVGVIVSVDGQTVRNGTTSSKGAYSFTRLAAGRYTVAFAGDETVFVGGDPASQPTSEYYRNSIRHVTVPKRLGTVTLNPNVAAAGRITGTGTSTSASVVVEHADGTPARTAIPSTEAFSVGGLAAGKYSVWYVTRQGATAHRTATVVAGRTTSLGALTLDGTAPTISGTVSGGPFPASVYRSGSGRVTFAPRIGHFLSTEAVGVIAGDGSYSAPRVVPGTYAVTVDVDHHVVASRTVTITPTTTRLDLQPGVLAGGVDLRFVTHGRTLPDLDVPGELADAAGDVADASKAGTYSFHHTVRAYDLDQKRFPAYDGPWWFVLPDDTFAVTAGVITHATVDVAIGR